MCSGGKGHTVCVQGEGDTLCVFKGEEKELQQLLLLEETKPRD